MHGTEGGGSRLALGKGLLLVEFFVKYRFWCRANIIKNGLQNLNISRLNRIKKR